MIGTRPSTTPHDPPYSPHHRTPSLATPNPLPHLRAPPFPPNRRAVQRLPHPDLPQGGQARGALQHLVAAALAAQQLEAPPPLVYQLHARPRHQPRGGTRVAKGGRARESCRRRCRRCRGPEQRERRQREQGREQGLRACGWWKQSPARERRWGRWREYHCKRGRHRRPDRGARGWHRQWQRQERGWGWWDALDGRRHRRGLFPVYTRSNAAAHLEPPCTFAAERRRVGAPARAESSCCILSGIAG